MKFGGMGRAFAHMGSQVRKKGSAAAPAYTGPGDIYTFAAWWGLRAYSSATRGNNVVRIVRASDSAEQDFVSLTTGALDVASITTFLNATTGKVVTLYDQTGGGKDVTQGTDANRPGFGLSVLGSLPAVQFVRANSTKLVSASAATINQPYNLSCVIDRTGNTGAAQGIYGDGGGGVSFAFNNSANTIKIFFGSNQTIGSVNDNAFHAIQILANGASSVVTADNSDTGVSPGTGTRSGTHIVGNDAFNTGFMDGNYMELGVASGDQSGSKTTMNSNQHAYYGF